MKVMRISLEVLRDDFTSHWFQEIVAGCTAQEIQDRIEQAIDNALKTTGDLEETRQERRERIFGK